jgi:3-hydroxyisobutyrate dehydrogenase-like beta-hydroxyacid dehydrogenase
MKIAFLGLGIMGRGMARNLALQGHEVTGWNRTARKSLLKGISKVKLAKTIADAMRGSEAVMVSLTGPDAQTEVFRGPGGVFAHVKEGMLILDMTTTDPAVTRDLAKEAQAKGAEFIDAPVFGSKDESWNGKLDVVWGGRPSLSAKLNPIFKAIAKSAHHMGRTSAGATMKLIGNNIVAAEFMALAEGLAMAKKAGIDRKRIPEVLAVVDYGSDLLKNNAKNALAGNYETFFSLNNMLKDTHLIADLARETGVPVYSNGVAVQSFQGAAAAGLGEKNASAIIKYLDLISTPGR